MIEKPTRTLDANQTSALRAVLLNFALQECLTRVVAHITTTGRLDIDDLDEIKASAIQRVKNSEVAGLMMRAESTILQLTASDLERVLSECIKNGRQGLDGLGG